MTAAKIDLQRPLDLFDAVALDDVAGAHVFAYLSKAMPHSWPAGTSDLVLEALERRELALVDGRHSRG